jgi:hypothetical protein
MGLSPMEDEKPYHIESPTRIRLGPLAKSLAQEQGMSLTEMAKHLLQQHKLRQGGVVQQDGEG